MSVYIGLDVGGTKIAGGAFDEEGQLLAEKVVPTPQEYPAFLDACEKMVAFLEKTADGKDFVGVGCPGDIDQGKGIVTGIVNIPELKEKPLLKDLSARFGVRTKLCNDAQCMALAEALLGTGQEKKSFVGLILGTGVGTAFIRDGKIATPTEEQPEDISQIILANREKEDGPAAVQGTGKAGTIESYLCGNGLSRLYAFVTGDEQILPEAIAEAVEGEGIARGKALKVLDRYYHILAKACCQIIDIYDTEIISVSGGLSSLPGMYEKVPTYIKEYNPDATVEFTKAILGKKAGMIGASLL